MDRKQKILNDIKNSEKPISATTLAQKHNVSRQIVVGDVALLRATGENIISTARGYIMDNNAVCSTIVVVQHDSNNMLDELYTIIDLGGHVEDVRVDHPVYGEIIAKLVLASRYDVDTFIAQSQKTGASPLSLLTEGLHSHMITAPNQEIIDRIVITLKEKHILFENKED